MIGSKDSYALVTGASTGIGNALARVLAKDGKNVVVVARSRDKLDELKAELENNYGTIVRVLPKDLCDPKAPQEIYSELEKEGIRIDVLVNNAGFGVYGKFYETDLQKELEMIQVNVISLIHLTKLFLKKMVENRSGSILNVSSLCAFIPGPLESMYCGTKALVRWFSEALANELKGTGVTVTCLYPGLVTTQFHKRANMEHTRAANRKMMDADTCAEAAYKALKKGKLTVIPGWEYKVGVILARVVPGIMIRMTRYQHEPA
ncbi:MAG TPA: SDR family oxidoreductase [Dehalococcoidia bacterium]|nr:SDR family oxidoreductase [Dehalococcoidia bacterium]